MAKARKEHIDRAIFMLGIAADYIDKNADPSDTIHYDGVQCDGYCVITDLHNAAAWLKKHEAR